MVCGREPAASWLSWIYHYPQAEYPYARLREENARRTRQDREFELADTGIFDDGRWWRIAVVTRKPRPSTSASASAFATPGRRRRRSTSCRRSGGGTAGHGTKARPAGHRSGRRGAPSEPSRSPGDVTSAAWRLAAGPDPEGRSPELLFCENETNVPSFTAARPRRPTRRTGSTIAVVSGAATVNPQGRGAKISSPLPPDGRPGRRGRLRLRLMRDDAATRARSRRGFRRRHGCAPARGRRIPRRVAAAGGDRRRGGDHAPGLRRHDLEPAVLSPQMSRVGSTAILPSPAARSPPTPGATPNGPSQRPRHHRHARHVGVPVVRRLGPRVPLHRARPCRSVARRSIRCFCCFANGTRIRTASFPPTNGTFPTSIRRFRPGRR